MDVRILGDCRYVRTGCRSPRRRQPPAGARPAHGQRRPGRPRDGPDRGAVAVRRAPRRPRGAPGPHSRAARPRRGRPARRRPRRPADPLVRLAHRRRGPRRPARRLPARHRRRRPRRLAVRARGRRRLPRHGGRRPLPCRAPPRRGLALWRGDPYAGVAAGPRLRREIERLEASRLSVLDQWLEAQLGLGRHAELVPELTGLVARYRTNEPLHAHLMAALLRCGRHDEALTAYERLRLALAAERGTEPRPGCAASSARSWPCATPKAAPASASASPRSTPRPVPASSRPAPSADGRPAPSGGPRPRPARPADHGHDRPRPADHGHDRPRPADHGRAP